VSAHTVKLTDDIKVPEGAWEKRFRVLAGVAVVTGAASLLGWTGDSRQFAFSYLVPFLFFLTLALGSIFFVLMNHLARSGWSVVLRRIPETASMTVGLFLVLFALVLLNAKELYEWTHADAVAQSELLAHKEPYLNLGFFIVRAVFYFLVWGLIASWFYRSSTRQDETADPEATVVMQRRAAPAMVLFALTLSFAAFDWLMSLEAEWFSTIFGVYVFAGSALAAFAFIALMALRLRAWGFLGSTIRDSHVKDLGRWMFAFSVFWAYIAFSQYFLIWYGNLPEEILFFLHRQEGSWQAVSYFLAFGHFVVPFMILITRAAKNSPRVVGALAVWILAMHYLDLYWLVMPLLHHDGFAIGWLDLACFLFVGSAFLAVFVKIYASRALVPVGDPRLAESLGLENDY
jgi:hypothetical protein